MPITEAQLAEKISKALNDQSDKQVDPKAAREKIGADIAAAVNQFVVGRLVNVIGVTPGSGTTTGTVQ